MERTFEALTAAENPPAVDSSVTPDLASPLDLNVIVSRLNDLTARLTKIENAEKSEPWHNGEDSAAPGYTDAEIDGEGKPAAEKKESEE